MKSSSRLVACRSCGCHVFASEATCPFCKSTLSRRLVATALSGLALLGCPKEPPKAEPDATAPVASPAADPRPIRERAAVYGPPPTMKTDGGVASANARGDCTIIESRATVPIEGADRVLAGLRPRFRASYNQGLQGEPAMEGSFVFTADVAADGTVTAVDAKASKGLSPAVVEGMTRALKNAQFSARASSSRLSATVTCTLPK